MRTKEEIKAYNRAYKQRPEYKAAVKEHRASIEGKAKSASYNTKRRQLRAANRKQYIAPIKIKDMTKLEYKEYRRILRRNATLRETPEHKEQRAIKRRLKRQSTEYKKKRKKYQNRPRTPRAIERARSPKYIRKARCYVVKTKYGLTLEQYESLRKSQNELCAICGHPETKVQKGKRVSLCLDHNHSTGQIRAFLCGKCNSILGYSNEDVDRLFKIIEYIKKWNSLAETK